MDDDLIEASIEEIAPSYTLIDVATRDLLKLDRDLQYDADLVNYLNGSTGFYLDPGMDQATASALHAQLLDPDLGGTIPYALTETPSEAQYRITAENGCLTIRQNAGLQYPVFRVANDARGVERISAALYHIAKWEFVRIYENTEVELQGHYPVAVHFEYVSPDGERVDLGYDNELVELPYENGTSIRMRVENTSQTKYYCALMYLSNTFESVGTLLDGKVLGISPGESAWVFNGQELQLTLEDHVKVFNMPASETYIKLIANKDEFRVESLELEALPAPTRECEREDEEDATRGLTMPSTRSVEEIPWFTRTIMLRLRNPDYSTENDH